MGYNIGLRLIEDFLAKSNMQQKCANFKDTAEVISKVGVSFKIKRKHYKSCLETLSFLYSFYRLIGLDPSFVSLFPTIGWLQDVSEHYPSNHQLECRQQTVLSSVRGKSPCRFRRASGWWESTIWALVFQYTVRCITGVTWDGELTRIPDVLTRIWFQYNWPILNISLGSNASRHALHKRCSQRRRYDRNEGHPYPLYRGRTTGRRWMRK